MSAIAASPQTSDDAYNFVGYAAFALAASSANDKVSTVQRIPIERIQRVPEIDLGGRHGLCEPSQDGRIL